MTTRAAARLVAVACLMLAMPVTSAQSQTDTSSANAVMPGCRSWLARDQRVNDLDQGLCAGQVEGIWGTAIALDRVCSPKGVILGQAIRVVVQFIDARPARMHERFTWLALEALIAAWPCK
jgi:hypothetical protein